MTDLQITERTEIVQEFSRKIGNLLDELGPFIVAMDQCCDHGNKNGRSTDMINKINTIFLWFHAVKRAAEFLNFTNIADSAGRAENLLEFIRTGSLFLTRPHLELLSQECEFIREAIDYVAENLEDKGMSQKSTVLKKKFLNEIDAKVRNTETIASCNGAESATGPTDLEVPEINLDIPLDKLVSPDLVKNFLSEAKEIIQAVESSLLIWLKSPDQPEIINDLFRNIHSYKGNCGFLGYGDLEKLSHQMETVMEAVKAGEKINRVRTADLMLKLVDLHREALEDILNGGQGKIEGLGLHLEELKSLLQASNKGGKQRKTEKTGSDKLGDILVEKGLISKEEVDAGLVKQNKQLGEILMEAGSVTNKQVAEALQIQEKRRSEKGVVSHSPENKRQDIRVDLSKLDNLINLIGELVIAENMVVNNPELANLELDGFYKSGQHLAKIVRDLQETAMTIRMIPVDGLFRRMNRLVHDLSRKSGKKVELQLSGEDTEVDKTVVEKITDPLVHIIRNSMDHGIEKNQMRVAAGKAETGLIQLSAAHEEGSVKISIEDDGGGLDRKILLKKAYEKGLVESEDVELTDNEVFQLIFTPGFSTAETISDISGRGVGMDVVRRNLEKIKGSADIKSKLGKGTRVELTIPLTLAIIEGMLVRTGESRYIIPIINILESFRPKPEMITITPDGLEVVKVRQDLLPVFRLHKLHDITPTHTELDRGILIVLESKKGNFCLFVDELLGQQQTVIKGLSDYISKFGNVGGVSGCTIMGNGEVCLIIDVRSVFEIAEESFP